ncbi:hypothetical protein GCM10025777_39340 [Membranihabitans marinus]|uniref:Zinc-finger domain-containing protein n=1 Tax=Nesterenkonia rhizosphaerae TaxID=1348272 RepID=A0ABP9G0F5_9MICC
MRHAKMSCPTGKARFKEQHLAERRIEEIYDRDVSPHRKPVRSYYCTECSGWHLTSMHKGENLGDYQSHRRPPRKQRKSQNARRFNW